MSLGEKKSGEKNPWVFQEVTGKWTRPQRGVLRTKCIPLKIPNWGSKTPQVSNGFKRPPALAPAIHFNCWPLLNWSIFIYFNQNLLAPRHLQKQQNSPGHWNFCPPQKKGGWPPPFHTPKACVFAPPCRTFRLTLVFCGGFSIPYPFKVCLSRCYLVNFGCRIHVRGWQQKTPFAPEPKASENIIKMFGELGGRSPIWVVSSQSYTRKLESWQGNDIWATKKKNLLSIESWLLNDRILTMAY